MYRISYDVNNSCPELVIATEVNVHSVVSDLDIESGAIKYLSRLHKRAHALGQFALGDSDGFGFGGSADVLNQDGVNFVTFKVPKGIETDKAWRTRVIQVTSSLHVLFDSLNKLAIQESNEPELTISTRVSKEWNTYGGNPVYGRLSEAAGNRLKNLPESLRASAGEFMKKGIVEFSKAVSDLGEHNIDRSGATMWENGSIHLSCFGPDATGIDTSFGSDYSLTPHNVDSHIQQIALIGGLAGLGIFLDELALA